LCGSGNLIDVILCENGPNGSAVLFDGAVEIVVAWSPDQVAPALERLDKARGSGGWIAGYIGYEAGLVLEPRLQNLARLNTGEPLLVFGVFDGPQSADARLSQPFANGAGLSPLRPQVERAAYDRAIAKIAEYIRAGDCYQINLTFPLESRLLDGTPFDLFLALRKGQAVGHGAYCDLGVGPIIVSRSPELFFSIDASGKISARPMKGTAPRGSDPVEDAALAEELFRSEKARAENLMIVDLLRNDISRLSEIGSVNVPELYKVEAFSTVHQMSSRVVGKLKGAYGLESLMRALFPCGSITGAPKIRAMQIIAELEPDPRGVYCGAIGWMAPDGQAAFNVAIRTLRVYPNGRVLMNAGGGVVADSTANGEWEEALWKTRFVQGLVRPN
jgi:para-aminobenzoate synthetase component 1